MCVVGKISRCRRCREKARSEEGYNPRSEMLVHSCVPQRPLKQRRPDGVKGTGKVEAHDPHRVKSSRYVSKLLLQLVDDLLWCYARRQIAAAKEEPLHGLHEVGGQGDKSIVGWFFGRCFSKSWDKTRSLSRDRHFHQAEEFTTFRCFIITCWSLFSSWILWTMIPKVTTLVWLPFSREKCNNLPVYAALLRKIYQKKSIFVYAHFLQIFWPVSSSQIVEWFINRWTVHSFMGTPL